MSEELAKRIRMLKLQIKAQEARVRATKTSLEKLSDGYPIAWREKARRTYKRSVRDKENFERILREMETEYENKKTQ